MADATAQLNEIMGELQQPPRSIHDMAKRANLCRQALSLLPRSQNEQLWAALQGELGNSLFQLPSGNRAENIEQAITAYQEALQVITRSAMPFEWALTMMNLALAYTDRIREDRAENIEQAIAVYQEALQVMTRAVMPVEWAITMTNFAIAYYSRIRGDRAENIEQAIAVYQDALQVLTYPDMPIDWATTMMNLANAYYSRIHGDRAKNIEQAIANYQESLQVMTRETMPIKWAETMTNLGNAYASRIHGDRAKNIEQAITTYQEAIQVRTRDAVSVEWAVTMNNLAIAYYVRIRGDRADNIEQAIVAYQETLQVRTRDAMPIKWAQTMNNLATAYKDRIRGNRADNIEQAIATCQDALQVRTRAAMPIEWATTMMNLGNAYLERVREDRAENIEQAIAAYQGALQVMTRAAMPIEWAETMMNLANAYLGRIRGDRAENIERAIAAYQEALQVRTSAAMPVEWAQTMHNLAVAYAERINGERAENIEQATTAYRDALSVQRMDLLPAHHRRTQHNLAHLLFTELYWSDAQISYQAAIQAGGLLLDAAYTEYGRQSEVHQTSQLYTHSAYCFYRLGQLAAALQQLEQGKTRLLGQALALVEANLVHLSPEQQTTMRSLRQTVRELDGEMRLPTNTPTRRSNRELAELLRQARAELSQQIEAARAEHPDFMPTGLNVADILALIPANGVLIAPCITSQGSFVFVVPSGVREVTGDYILPIPDLTTAYLTELLQGPKDEDTLGGWLGAYGCFRDEPNQTNQEAWFEALHAVSGQLWDALMGPIHQRLQALNLPDNAPVLLMPQGGLGLLPLHVSWREVDGQPRTFGDYYTVTYAPSAYALHISRQRATQPERQARSLFAAINPTRDLTYTPVEGEAVSQLFPPASRTIVYEDEATATTFPSLVKGRAYIHYSGHGYYHWGAPLQSGLRLADKPYTLSDILSELDLNACRLVTLSACETGITEFQEAPDEYVGLPAGFLQAGAPAVISTLWAVNDLSTMLLMERFYQLHLQDGLEMAAALRQAQLWLRDVTAQELANRFGEERMKLKGSRLRLAEAGDYWQRFAAMEPESQPFNHPYYWAAFTFTGA